MSAKSPTYVYILAVIYGLIAFVLPGTVPFGMMVTTALFFLIGGAVFGFVWPRNSWRWGLWIAGPMVFFLGLSVLFAGQLDVFIKKDLPPLLIAIIAACLGSFIGAQIKQRQLARHYQSSH